MNPEPACDVLILGAGPAGCATALGLAAAGVERVLLLDKPVAQPFRIGESATPNVAGLLEQLGLEHRLERLGHLPYHGNLSCWGGEREELNHFLFRGQGHGWHLDRAAFDAWLRQAATRKARLLGGSIAAVLPAADGWRVQVKGRGEIFARVLVDAAGRRSPLATRLCAKRRRLDGLMALAVHTAPAHNLSGLSLVESFADGWWYAAGLPDGRTLVTLMSDHDIVKTWRYNEQGIFLQTWRNTRLLAKRVPPPSALSSIGAFAAHSGCIDRAAGRRWIAVGDALMGFDPLTSSGIAGALDDAQAAVPAILSQLDGNPDAARRYAQRANAGFRRYLEERRRHYRAERRWVDRPFWARRVG